MSGSWGRFTVYGGASVERYIGELVQRVVDAWLSLDCAGHTRALVLLGGYGRGEGGVQSIQGREWPHNNLDFLLITEAIGRESQLQLESELQQQLSIIEGEAELVIGLDLSVVDAARLSASEARLIWYDMRYGHKTIAGDMDFVPGLQRQRLEAVADWDVRNLLVNRGALLVINQLLMVRPNGSEHYARLIIKHMMKAIIGYGDAMLYFTNNYHFSYLEKQRRMRNLGVVDDAFKALYEEAMEFRFRPDYARYLQRDIAAWQEAILPLLSELHLQCERRRLGQSELSWQSYLSQALLQGGQNYFHASYRELANSVLGFVQSFRHRGLNYSTLAFKHRLLTERQLIPLLYPGVVYPFVAETLRQQVQDIIAVDDIDTERRLYLLAWAKGFDGNAIKVFERYGVL